MSLFSNKKTSSITNGHSQSQTDASAGEAGEEERKGRKPTPTKGKSRGRKRGRKTLEAESVEMASKETTANGSAEKDALLMTEGDEKKSASSRARVKSFLTSWSSPFKRVKPDLQSVASASPSNVELKGRAIEAKEGKSQPISEMEAEDSAPRLYPDLQQLEAEQNARLGQPSSRSFEPDGTMPSKDEEKHRGDPQEGGGSLYPRLPTPPPPSSSTEEPSAGEPFRPEEITSPASTQSERRANASKKSPKGPKPPNGASTPFFNKPARSLRSRAAQILAEQAGSQNGDAKSDGERESEATEADTQHQQLDSASQADRPDALNADESQRMIRLLDSSAAPSLQDTAGAVDESTQEDLEHAQADDVESEPRDRIESAAMSSNSSDLPPEPVKDAMLQQAEDEADEAIHSPTFAAEDAEEETPYQEEAAADGKDDDDDEQILISGPGISDAQTWDQLPNEEEEEEQGGLLEDTGELIERDIYDEDKENAGSSQRQLTGAGPDSREPFIDLTAEDEEGDEVYPRSEVDEYGGAADETFEEQEEEIFLGPLRKSRSQFRGPLARVDEASRTLDVQLDRLNLTNGASESFDVDPNLSASDAVAAFGAQMLFSDRLRLAPTPSPRKSSEGRWRKRNPILYKEVSVVAYSPQSYLLTSSLS